jgi:hypothetical protein
MLVFFPYTFRTPRADARLRGDGDVPGIRPPTQLPGGGNEAYRAIGGPDQWEMKTAPWKPGAPRVAS